MADEKNLNKLLQTMKPSLSTGDYVFCTVPELPAIDIAEIIMTFKEQEGTTIIIKKQVADTLKLSYSFIASWITLTVHSSLEAVGLTAAFSQALTDAGISCNVVAAYYHDHIFVNKKDTDKAICVLNKLSEGK